MIFGRKKAGRKKNPDEYEGWWEAPSASPSPAVHGKIEWEPSMDGGTEIDLLVSKLDLPDGATVDVTCDGELVISGTVENGKVRKILKSADGHPVPRLAGKRVELRHGDTVLAETVLEAD
jgi:hypothetical protein